MLLLNLMLTIVWLLLTAEFTLTNFLFGFVISFLMVSLSQRAMKPQVVTVRQGNYFLRTMRGVFFGLFFLKELVVASLYVLASIIVPDRMLKPGVIAIPLDLETDAQITLLANVITLTPGTLTLDVSRDKKTIYVHSIRVDDPESFRQQIKNGFERRILEVARS